MSHWLQRAQLTVQRCFHLKFEISGQHDWMSVLELRRVKSTTPRLLLDPQDHKFLVLSQHLLASPSNTTCTLYQRNRVNPHKNWDIVFDSSWPYISFNTLYRLTPRNFKWNDPKLSELQHSHHLHRVSSSPQYFPCLKQTQERPTTASAKTTKQTTSTLIHLTVNNCFPALYLAHTEFWSKNVWKKGGYWRKTVSHLELAKLYYHNSCNRFIHPLYSQ